MRMTSSTNFSSSTPKYDPVDNPPSLPQHSPYWKSERTYRPFFIPGLPSAFILIPYPDPDFVEIRRRSSKRHRVRKLLPQILVASFFLAIIVAVIVTGILFVKSDKKTQAKNELGSGQFHLLSLCLVRRR